MVTSQARAGWLRAARVASALALFVVAGDHLYEYSSDYYSAIPTIGTLFLLNAIGGFAIGAALLDKYGAPAPSAPPAATTDPIPTTDTVPTTGASTSRATTAPGAGSVPSRSGAGVPSGSGVVPG